MIDLDAIEARLELGRAIPDSAVHDLVKEVKRLREALDRISTLDITVSTGMDDMALARCGKIARAALTGDDK